MKHNYHNEAILCLKEQQISLYLILFTQKISFFVLELIFIIWRRKKIKKLFVFGNDI